MYRAIAECGYPNCAVFTFTLYLCRSVYCEMRGESHVHLTIGDTCCPLFWIYLWSFEGESITVLQGNKIKAVPLSFA